ncbi:MAG TPA: hypothetical protein VM865_10640 [Acidobacteriaceae bacterium]|nr:hypothetical protein [Acidobacteriaceae bacterium]
MSHPVRLHAFQEGELEYLLPRLATEVRHCGCWLTYLFSLSKGRAEIVFEVPPARAVDLYGVLLGFGLQLTVDSHYRLAALCALHHYRGGGGGSRRARLQIEFG